MIYIIYIIYFIYNSFKYPVRWQKLLGSARSGSTALCYRNCFIIPWLAADEDRVSHVLSHVV